MKTVAERRILKDSALKIIILWRKTHQIYFGCFCYWNNNVICMIIWNYVIFLETISTLYFSYDSYFCPGCNHGKGI